jgi:hypothetical protein
VVKHERKFETTGIKIVLSDRIVDLMSK